MPKLIKQQDGVYNRVLIPGPDRAAKEVIAQYAGFFASYRPGSTVTIEFYMENRNDHAIYQEFLSALEVAGWNA